MWRTATVSDDDAIVSMVRSLYDEDPGPAPVPETHARSTLARFRAEPSRGVAVVLEVDGALVGYALLVSFWSNELGGEACIIDELYVSPAGRGAGHGSRLLKDLAARRTGWFANAAALMLETTPKNARARRLYERVGFKAANLGMRLPCGR